MRRKGTKRPTMLDVARHAGVSQTTVSFVMNNVATANIPDETRTRIREAIRELGYRPNAVAKGLRTSQSDTIGFITDEIATTPYAGDVIKGAQDLAWASGKVLVVVNTGGSPARAAAAIEMLLERRVEGIIYAAMYHQVVSPLPGLREAPCVLVDCYCADRSLPSVVPDEVGGGEDATALLLRQGRRRIGLINLEANMTAAIGRLEGYRRALAAAGVPFDPALVRNGEGHAHTGYIYARELLRAADPPTAIFCATDRTAMGAYDAIRECGLTIPRDVAVVGFDNQTIISECVRPPLTTLQLPHYEMGQWAVRYLLAHVRDGHRSGPLPPIQETLPCPLIERASTQSPPDAIPLSPLARDRATDR
jgi:LacI family transcriptional regulator